jgi:hypothetical protein
VSGGERGQGSFQRRATTLIEPSEEHAAELGSVRRRDLMALSKRLGRVEAPPKGRWWLLAAQLLLGAALGAGIGALPLFSSTTELDS